MRCRDFALKIAVLLLIACHPIVSVAQVGLDANKINPDDPDLLHSTLRGWADDSWRLISHRTGSGDVRFSTRGILQRYNNLIDGEYDLDLLTKRFPLPEDYRWWNRPNGIRWSGASVSREFLVVDGDFKSRFDIDENWDIGARFALQSNHAFERSTVWVDASRRISKSTRITGAMSLDAIKPDGDIELGIQTGRETTRNVKVSLALLDWLNNVIHVGLKAYQQAETDSTVRYTKQPFAVRTEADYRFSSFLRAEVYGAYMTPTKVEVYEADDRTAGFEQDERFGYIGVNLEIAPNTALRLGPFVTYIDARTNRRALSTSADVPEYDLKEVTTRAGASVLQRLGRTWHAEAIVAREWQTEKRDRLDPGEEDVDYLNIGWTGEVLLVKRPVQSGFQLDVGVAASIRSVERGHLQVPAAGSTRALDRDNWRGRIDAGYRFTPNLSGWLGAAFDLDQDGSGNFWGGGRGRFTFTW